MCIYLFILMRCEVSEGGKGAGGGGEVCLKEEKQEVNISGNVYHLKDKTA